MTRRADDLELLRAKLLKALGAAEAKEVAGISKELRAVNAELEALAPPVADPDVEFLDDLRARAARRSAS